MEQDATVTIRKEREWMLDRLGLREATIVSFDIRETDGARRSALHKFIYGRVDRKEVNGSIRTYRYGGLIHHGGFRLGQSVYLFPPDLASRLIVKLRELRINHTYWDVFLDH